MAATGTGAEPALASRLESLDTQGLRGEYLRQGSFVYVENFLPADITARLIDA